MEKFFVRVHFQKLNLCREYKNLFLIPRFVLLLFPFSLRVRVLECEKSFVMYVTRGAFSRLKKDENRKNRGRRRADCIIFLLFLPTRKHTARALLTRDSNQFITMSLLFRYINIYVLYIFCDCSPYFSYPLIARTTIPEEILSAQTFLNLFINYRLLTLFINWFYQ